MGLLTAPLTVAREPLRLTLRVWELGLSTAAEAARIGTELLDPARGEQLPDIGDQRTPERPAYRGDGHPPAPVEEEAPAEPAATPEPAATGVPPAVPEELVPDHVDEEPVLVAETAEAGAEEGAGAELHVEPPWDGYDQMTAADIRDRLAAANAAEAAAVELYEAAGKKRRSVLDAAERALRGLR